MPGAHMGLMCKKISPLLCQRTVENCSVVEGKACFPYVPGMDHAFNVDKWRSEAPAPKSWERFWEHAL